MALPVAERIAVKVRERLLLIDERNDYETTVSDIGGGGGVIRPTRVGGIQPLDWQLVVTQGDATRNDQLSMPGNPPATAWNLPFIIAGHLRPSEMSETPIDTLRNQFWADVVRAICVPTASWYTWDSLAIDSMVSGVREVVSEENTTCGFHLTLSVTYRTDENDPYTVRA